MILGAGIDDDDDFGGPFPDDLIAYINDGTLLPSPIPPPSPRYDEDSDLWLPMDHAWIEDMIAGYRMPPPPPPPPDVPEVPPPIPPRRRRREEVGSADPQIGPSVPSQPPGLVTQTLTIPCRTTHTSDGMSFHPYC